MALKGIQILEIAGLAPAPFCGMILSDFGAKVIRICKATGFDHIDSSVSHGKQCIGLDLKNPEGVKIFKKLAERSDVIIDPFRPGITEKLGIGPNDFNNKKLIYARISGFGQNGPLAKAAGHDINYLSISGVLSLFGWRNKAPTPPVNIVADFGGGGLMCAFGIVMALLEREKSGMGQVVDCSMTRGAAYLTSWVFRSQNFLWPSPRGENLLDGGCYFYDTYETKDGKWMAVGALEKKFYDNLLSGLEISDTELPYMSPVDVGRTTLANKFKEHSQEHWIKVFSKIDACVTPVLTPEEAEMYDHNKNQNVFQRLVDGSLAPTPEPRLSRTPGKSACVPAPQPGQDTIILLKNLGYNDAEIKSLADKEIIKITSKAKL